jgi:DNA invertase Pin-like site-specific DNA recombinase
MKRVAIWAAVSSLPQAKKVSLNDQLASGRSHAERHGASVVAELIVPGESRDIVLFEEACRRIAAYEQLQGLINNRSIDVLIYLDRSRLGRTAALSMAVAELCNRAGILLYEMDSPPASIEFEKFDHDDLLLGAIKSVGAQQELRKFQQRRVSGMAGRVRRGDFPGEIPWPWVERFTDDGTRYVEVDTTGRMALLSICDLYLLHGASLNDVAGRLNAAGHTSPRGGPWASGNVVWIIRNIWRYAGYVEYNKHSTAGFEYIKAKSKWPAIIDDATAEAVSAERHRRWFARGSVHSTHRFSQIVWCSVCNQRMDAKFISTTVKSKTYTYEMYYCSNKHPGRSVMAWKVEHWIRKGTDVLSALDNLADYMPETEDRTTALQSQLTKHDERIVELRAQLERADDAYTTGTMTADRYQRQVERIEKQMAIVQAQRNDVANTLSEEMRAGNRLERLEEIVAFGHFMLVEPDITKANAWFRRHWRVWILDNEVKHAEAI